MTVSLAAGLIVRPIRYTASPDAVTATLAGLGLRVDAGHGDRRVLSAGAGRIAVHAVAEGDPLAGGTMFGLELGQGSTVADLDRLGTELLDRGVVAQRFTATHGPSLRVSLRELTFLVDLPIPVGHEPVAEPRLSVLAVLYADDVAGLRAGLARVGLGRRTGGAGGLVGVHGRDIGEPGRPTRTALAFEHAGPVAVLRSRLAGAGLPVALIEESSPPALRVPDPDGGEFRVDQAQLSNECSTAGNTPSRTSFA